MSFVCKIGQGGVATHILSICTCYVGLCLSPPPPPRPICRSPTVFPTLQRFPCQRSQRQDKRWGATWSTWGGSGGAPHLEVIFLKMRRVCGVFGRREFLPDEHQRVHVTNRIFTSTSRKLKRIFSMYLANSLDILRNKLKLLNYLLPVCLQTWQHRPGISVLLWVNLICQITDRSLTCLKRPLCQNY